MSRMALLGSESPAADGKMMELMQGGTKDAAFRELALKIGGILRGAVTADDVVAYQAIKSTNAVHTQGGHSSEDSTPGAIQLLD